MERIGLTGSIGMGKSTTAAMLRHLRVPVFDADAAVHQLTGPGGAAVPAIAALFPTAVRDGAVDRQILGGIVFADRAALRRLEAVLHPLSAAPAAASCDDIAGPADALWCLTCPCCLKLAARSVAIESSWSARRFFSSVNGCSPAPA